MEGIPPLLTTEDIDAMFRIVDTLNKGSISGQQAIDIGKTCGLELNLEATEVVTKEQFSKLLSS